ncbi:MAG: hypothetical protein WD885_02310 [Candidatus Saccharimonadales bacterium]
MRGRRDTCLGPSLNEGAIEIGNWRANPELANALIDDATETGAQELDIDADAVVGALAKLRELDVPTIPFLQVGTSGTEETVYGASLNTRGINNEAPIAGEADVIQVAGMLLGGINNGSEEQGLYLAYKLGLNAENNQELTDALRGGLSEEVSEADPTNEAKVELLTPADYMFANASSRRLRSGLMLDRFAVYSYITGKGALGVPSSPYTLFPQTVLDDGSALLAHTKGEKPVSNFMRGRVAPEGFSVGVRFSITQPDIVGQGSIPADMLANLTSHDGARA